MAHRAALPACKHPALQVVETAGTGLFVVYNNTESLEGLGPINRVFIVKYVRQFDLLN